MMGTPCAQACDKVLEMLLPGRAHQGAVSAAVLVLALLPGQPASLILGVHAGKSGGLGVPTPLMLGTAGCSSQQI